MGIETHNKFLREAEMQIAGGLAAGPACGFAKKNNRRSLDGMAFDIGEEVHHTIFKINAVVMDRKITEMPGGNIYHEYTLGRMSSSGDPTTHDVTDAWLKLGRNESYED